MCVPGESDTDRRIIGGLGRAPARDFSYFVVNARVFAAVSIIDATACGCDTYTAWLPLTSITVEPARLDMARWASGGIILSSVATRYQLRFALHAGWLIV